jgi:hypothetical protein
MLRQIQRAETERKENVCFYLLILFSPVQECPMIILTEEEQNKLEALFAAGAAKEDVVDAYWIHGADTGEDYCFACAKKAVAALSAKDPAGEYSVDGGYPCERDSLPFCETCGLRLDGCLTDYGCSEELDHFIENGFAPANTSDCYSMDEVINRRGWNHSKWVQSDERSLKYFRDLHELGRRILDALK